MRLKKVKFKRTTSIAEPLDAVLERIRLTHQIDCFIVAWDLVPPWDKSARMCRWDETLTLFEGLSLSDKLDSPFRDFAAARFHEMSHRIRPSARSKVPKPVDGGVLAVCVDPLFESIFMDERAMKQALGVGGKRITGWPIGWDRDNVDASEVIGTAVDAAREAVPSAKVFRRIHQGYETLKTEWGIHFIQSGAFDVSIKRHPLGKRLAEIGRKPAK